MNKLKKHMLIAIAAAMTSSYCMAVESYDCDSTAPLNCHPQYSINPCQWIGSDGTDCDNADYEESAGSANIQMCYADKNNQGNCSQNGTVGLASIWWTALG